MSQPLITLLTPTGHRQEAFSLCEKYIERQDYKGPIEWVVCCDNWQDPTKCTLGQTLIKGPMEWIEGINTQRPNMTALLEHVRGEYCFIIEEDDYLRPEYISVMLDFLKYAALVGESDAVYYSLKTHSYLELKNYHHASLCSTAFKKSLVPLMYRAVNSGALYMDLALYGSAKANHIKTILFNGLGLCVGMKGLPGRPGIGCGHRPDQSFVLDEQDKLGNWKKLRRLVGLDDKNYTKWIE